MLSTEIEKDDKLKTLIASVSNGANKRVLGNIDLIVKICQEQEKRGSTEFTVAMIGGLSSEQGGISAQSIRNDKYGRYKAIIEAFKQKNSKRKKSAKVREEDDWIENITDSNSKYLALSLVAENKHLRSQLQTTRQLKEVFLDLTEEESRPQQKTPSNLDLFPMELKALKDFVSQSRLDENGWTRTEHGQLVDQDGVELCKAGLMSAIEKILTVDPNHG
jgi:hypothetical protein